IRVDTAGDARARGTRAAGIAIDGRQTVERLSERDRGLPFSRAARAGKDEARRQRSARNGAGEEIEDSPMAGEISVGHRQLTAVPAATRRVRCSSELDAITLSAGLFLGAVLVLLVGASADAEETRPEAALLFGLLGRMGARCRRLNDSARR